MSTHCMVCRLHGCTGCMVCRLHGLQVAWFAGCMVAWVAGCMVAWVAEKNTTPTDTGWNNTQRTDRARSALIASVGAPWPAHLDPQLTQVCTHPFCDTGKGPPSLPTRNKHGSGVVQVYMHTLEAEQRSTHQTQNRKRDSQIRQYAQHRW